MKWSGAACVRAAAEPDARARGVRLTAAPVEDGITVEADRQVLSAVVSNLLQNAFKFTRQQTVVTMRAGRSEERVLIEIEDECGGLPTGDTDEMFRPFEQRSRPAPDSGWPSAAGEPRPNCGRLYVRSLPGKSASSRLAPNVVVSLWSCHNG